MKLECDTAKRQLTLLHAGVSLDADLREHITACEDCRQVFTSNQALWSLLGEYEIPDLTVDLFPRVKQQLNQGRRGPLRERLAGWIAELGPRPRLAGAAPAVLGIAIGAWMGTTLATMGDVQTSAAPGTVESEAYAAIFAASPPGFLGAADPWDQPEGRAP